MRQRARGARNKVQSLICGRVQISPVATVSRRCSVCLISDSRPFRWQSDGVHFGGALFVQYVGEARRVLIARIPTNHFCTNFFAARRPRGHIFRHRVRTVAVVLCDDRWRTFLAAR